MTSKSDNGQRELLPQVSETAIDAAMAALEHSGTKLGRPAKAESRFVSLKVRHPPVGPQPDLHILAQAGSRKSAGESGTIVTEQGRIDWEASTKVARVLLYKATKQGAVLYAKIERFDTSDVTHSMDLIVEELGRRPETRRSVLSLRKGPTDD